jgi:imidazolonepropionase-like amidohydrolase
LPSTENVFCGHACVVKTAGSPEKRAIAPERAVVMAVCSDPTSRNRSRTRPDSIYVRQPTNRMGVMWIARNSLHQAANKGAEIGKTADGGLDAATLTILAGIVTGQTEVISVSRTDYDIRSALELGDEFGFQPVIYGGDEVYRIVDEFASSGARLAYTALTTNANPRSLRGDESTELRWNVPGVLQRAGIEFCLAGDSLLEKARFAVRFGLSPEVALEAITLRPARMLGLQESIGSIKVGKEADLVALSGDPLQPTSAVTWTMVHGKLVFCPD